MRVLSGPFAAKHQPAAQIATHARHSHFILKWTMAEAGHSYLTFAAAA